ncbi:MAG TPA: hypothetical protein VME19_13680 [Streptosporangiaceae bacterium]|nr:hypothetical protein [Streptosporangiaceae bacterium]
MAAGPVPRDPGRGEDPPGGPANPWPEDHWPDPGAGWHRLPSQPEPAEEDIQAWLDRLESEGEPPDPEMYPDPDDPPLPGEIDLDAIAAECAEIAAEEADAAERAAGAGAAGALAGGRGRRGPGQPGSAQSFPGEYAGPAGSFASGQALDTAPGCAALAALADAAAGDGDSYADVSDDELVGLICAWQRVGAHVAARAYTLIAELIRRRAEPGWPLEGPGRLPRVWDEFLPTELSHAMAWSRNQAEGAIGMAYALEALPGTKAALCNGIIDDYKASIIVGATAALDVAEARAAEAMVLDRAGRLTPGALRAAINRAVMEVAPDKAKKRREEAAEDARVERWAERSGNAALAGRDLPPADVLAADQRVNWWAQQLRKAGLDGTMDQLRARAYLDLLLGLDSRPPVGHDATPADRDGSGPNNQRPDGPGPDGPGPGGSDPGGPGPGGSDPGGSDPRGSDPGGSGSGGPGQPPAPPSGGPLAGAIPPGFVGKGNLTIPLLNLLGLADRPGELGSVGPIDPALARDLAAAAARNPRTTWCVTVTDDQGHAIGHGCARPEPRSSQTARQQHSAPDGPDPPGFTFTASGEPGPPGGYGTWRLTTGPPGTRGLIVALHPIAVDTCDHRFEASGHDPGSLLRHLTEIRHATCTGPTCRRPSSRADFEHNTPYEAGGRTCECNGSPKCRTEHRIKQDPRWKVEQVTPAVLRWTTPSGRQYETEPTRYPI